MDEIQNKNDIEIELNKYPKKISAKEANSFEALRFFLFPKAAYFNDAEIDQFEFLVFSLICYLSSTSGMGRITSVPISAEYIAQIGLLSRRKIKDIESSIEAIKEYEFVEAKEFISGTIQFQIDISGSFSKVNSHEFEKIINEKTLSVKENMTLIYIRLNGFMFRDGKDKHCVCYQPMAYFQEIANISRSTTSRLFARLEDIEAIARYTISLKGSNSSGRKNVWSCYHDRDALRRYVEGELSSSNGIYSYLHKDFVKERESNSGR